MLRLAYWAFDLDQGYTLYSLRRGGATHWYRTFGDMLLVLYRGRREDSRTARIYVTEGLAVLGQLGLSELSR